MSDAAVTTDQAEEKPRRKKRKAGLGALAPLFLLMLLPVAPATFTVVAPYMAPTLLLAMFRALHMPGAIATVAGLNFAGTLPALHFLWTNGNDFDTAYLLIFNLEFMFMNLAAAGLGVSLLWISPFIARTWVDIAGQRLLAKAEEEREKLIDEWGEELAEPEIAEADEEEDEQAAFE